MRPIDLVICGQRGGEPAGASGLARDAGYSDIEVARLVEADLISERTIIMTTAHDLQVVDDDLPEAAHDFSVDLIVTATQAISGGAPRGG